MKIALVSMIFGLMVMGVASAADEFDADEYATDKYDTDRNDSDKYDTDKNDSDKLVSLEKLKEKTEDEEQVSDTQSPTSMLEEILAKRKTGLNGTKWSIDLKPMGTGKKKGNTVTDVITFSENKVISENMADLGFSATNFSARLEEDGTLIWETMQTSEEEGTAFWRGDIGPDDVMRGVLSKRGPEDESNDYNFSGKKL